uniref:Glycolipid transfer protein n=1 Tax=Cacopsylla melanoneura TaxID=428564 RepID=A0A8D8PLE6_9HEMI
MSLVEDVRQDEDFVEVATDSTDTIFLQIPLFPVANEEYICTAGFLEASRGIVILIDLFGTFGLPMKRDVQGNIDKLAQVYNENVPANSNLIDLLKSELPQGGVAIESLLWLRRGLHFFYEFFELLRTDFENSKVKEDLKEYIRKAYDIHLRRHHGWFLQQTFRGLCTLAPKHHCLVRELALGKINMEAVVYKSMKEFMSHLNNNLTVLVNFYKTHNLE